MDHATSSANRPGVLALTRPLRLGNSGHRPHRGCRQLTALAALSTTAPTFSVPTITLEGGTNGGAPHPDASAYAQKSAGKYAHRIIIGGVGHNLPQEAPQEFAQVVVDVAKL